MSRHATCKTIDDIVCGCSFFAALASLINLLVFSSSCFAFDDLPSQSSSVHLHPPMRIRAKCECCAKRCAPAGYLDLTKDMLEK